MKVCSVSELVTVGLVFACLLAVSCGQQKKGSYPTDQKSTHQESQWLQVIELSVKGMTCTGCEAAISSALQKLPGVISVDAYYMDGLAIIHYDTTKTKLEQIRQAIIDSGYEPGDYVMVSKENE